MTLRRFVLSLIAVALCGCASAPERQARKQEDLFAERRAQDAARGEGAKRLVAQMLARVEAKARSPQRDDRLPDHLRRRRLGRVRRRRAEGLGPRCRRAWRGRSSTSSPA